MKEYGRLHQRQKNQVNNLHHRTLEPGHTIKRKAWQNRERQNETDQEKASERTKAVEAVKKHGRPEKESNA